MFNVSQLLDYTHDFVLRISSINKFMYLNVLNYLKQICIVMNI